VANNYDVSIKRHNCTSGMILRPELAAGMAKLPFKLGVLRKRERLIFRPPEPNPAAAKRNNYFPSCTHPTTTLPSPPSLPIQRPGLITRQDAGATAPHNHDVQAFFYAHHFVKWRLCVGDLRVCRVPVSPVYQPAHSCHPFA
jgi:hypothetical protein